MRIVTLACAGIALLALCVPASALSINPVDIETSTDVVNALLGGASISVVGGSVVFTDVTTGASPADHVPQSAIYSGFGTVGIGPHPDGILLTSGIGALTTGAGDLPTTNDFENFSHVSFTPFEMPAGTGTDADLHDLIGNAFTISDVNMLEFSFTVAAGVTSIEVDFVFASEEYGEVFTGDDFRDVFGFWVDGVNQAFLGNGSEVFVSVANAGEFNDNWTDPTSYALEYDGITNSIHIVANLDTSVTEHTLKIAIGDAGDNNFDSGVFIGNLRASGDQGPDNPIPEPTSIALLGLGLVGIGLVARKRRRS